MTTTAEAQAAEGLTPCRALARIYEGDELVAETRNAVSTTFPEIHGRILVPKADLGDQAPRLSAYVLEERNGPDGPLVALDHTKLRIVLYDTLPGWRDGGMGNPCRFPRWGDAQQLLWMMDAQRIGVDLFETPSYDETRRNVVEAGQVMGAQIVAASRSIPDKRVTSIHTVLSRPAVFDKPIRLRPAFPRLGRNFATVTVESEQEGKSVASSLILMDKGAEDVIRSQAPMPDVPGPDESPDYDYRMSGRFSRFVDDAYAANPDRVGPPEIQSWVRFREQPTELCLKQALLAQYVGHMTIAAAMRPHKGITEKLAHESLSTGILAVTIDFHDEPDLTDWMLYSNPAIYAGRGLAQGQGMVFARGGQLLASYTVQAMIRRFEQDPASLGDGNRRM